MVGGILSCSKIHQSTINIYNYPYAESGTQSAGGLSRPTEDAMPETRSYTKDPLSNIPTGPRSGIPTGPRSGVPKGPKSAVPRRPDTSAGGFTRRRGQAVLSSGIYKSRQAPSGYGASNRRLVESSRTRGPSSYSSDYRSCTGKSSSQPWQHHVFKPQEQGRVMSPEEYFPGLIFRAPFFEQSYDTKIDPKYLIEDGQFGPVCRKVRKFIVVACYEESYVAVPLYTFSNNGLNKKIDEAKDSYVSVRDHRSKSPPLQLSRHDPLFTCSLEPEAHPYKDSTVCHITGVSSHWYSTRVIKEGYLTLDSIERLQALPGVIVRREISCNSPYRVVDI